MERGRYIENTIVVLARVLYLTKINSSVLRFNEFELQVLLQV